MSEQINVPGLLDQAPAAEKALQAIVSIHEGKVVLHFNAPREYVALTNLEPLVVGARLIFNGVTANPEVAQEAVNLAMALVDYVYEQRSDLKPAGGGVKAELINRHRRKLVPRITLMLNSQREQRTVSNQDLARQLIDAVFHEVFA